MLLIAREEHPMTQPNRPHRQFSEGQQVNTNDERRGETIEAEWCNGEWTYWVMFDYSDKLVRYAEHELEAVR
jgi:hypothetical protein